MIDRIAGCLFGMACGDALGADVEFITVEAILQQYPPSGPTDLPHPARVTDDTQMALAVGRALMQAPRPYEPNTFETALRETYIQWYNDPENNRAPGVTCMDSIENLTVESKWQDATNISAKGCGANMRVQPIGLLPVDEPTRAGLAQFQAALTHGHATGLAAADLTAWVINDLMHNGNIITLPTRIRRYIDSQRRVYHEKWLGDLYLQAMIFREGADFIEYGWEECLKILDKMENALAIMDKATDPSELVGKGWIAEEAFATALYCFLLYPDDPVAVMRRAVVTSGDSDSIACIAGAFAGAYMGLTKIPADWVARMEYRDDLNALAQFLNTLHTESKSP